MEGVGKRSTDLEENDEHDDGSDDGEDQTSPEDVGTANVVNDVGKLREGGQKQTQRGFQGLGRDVQQSMGLLPFVSERRAQRGRRMPFALGIKDEAAGMMCIVGNAL